MTYELRTKQVPGYTRLVTQRRHLLRYTMGTGKTVVTTKAMYDTMRRCVLIICPTNAIRVWEDHIKEWYNGLDAVCGKDTSFNIHRVRWKYNNANRRKAVFQAFDAGADVNVYITTAGAFLRDYEILTHNFDCIIVDEAKRVGLMSHKSKLFELLKPFCRNLGKDGCFWSLTGTPGYSPEHFFSLFHLMDPKLFGSYWRFVDTFCYTQMTNWGREILGLKKDAQEGWYRLLSAKSSALTKEEMGHNPTQRQILRVTMDESQRVLYDQFDKEMYAVTGEGDIIIAQTAMTKVQRFRQLLVCPKILDPTASMGAAFYDFVETIKDDPHVVLFTPFTQAIPHFKEGLSAAGYASVFTLSGEERLTPDQLKWRIDEFRRTRGIIICSILYATSFSLEPAKSSYFIGYDYDPDNNEQAEERLNRLTTPHLVNAYYYAYEGTYDDDQCFIVNVKRMQGNVTLNIGHKESAQN